MSTISIEVAERRLRITHTEDNSDLQQALDGAEQEALRFLNREYLPTLPFDYPASSSSEDYPTSEDPVAADVVEAVLLLVKASFEATTPEEIEGYRKAALIKLQPYRLRLGV